MDPAVPVPPPPIPPPLILPRLAAGEPRAMNECIDRFGGLIWSIVKRAVPNESEAEDLMQQILTEVWRKAGAYNPATASESTFVALVARRRTIDHQRRAARQPILEPIEAAASLPADEFDADTEPCDADALRASLASLPEDTRQLFRLFFEQGFTHQEIAMNTGVALGTVKTRLRRGLLTLREHLRRSASTLVEPNP